MPAKSADLETEKHTHKFNHTTFHKYKKNQKVAYYNNLFSELGEQVQN